MPVPLSAEFNPRRPGSGGFAPRLPNGDPVKSPANIFSRGDHGQPDCVHRHPEFNSAIACAKRRKVGSLVSVCGHLSITLAVGSLHTWYCREARRAMKGIEEVCLCADEACDLCGHSLGWDEGRLQECRRCA